jgi:hypothetical protein
MLTETYSSEPINWLHYVVHRLHWSTYMMLCDQRRAEDAEFRSRVVEAPVRVPSRRPAKRGAQRK